MIDWSCARVVLMVAVTTLALVTAPLRAADGGAEGWYVIRPGDTLEGLATQFLGGPQNWAELHRLNPRILDPHWIYPGRRVRVPIARPSARPSAQVTVVANRVEARPTPVDWLPAGAGDLLIERDGLRTYEDASARLLFDDGTSAIVSQDSLVFIRRQTPATDPAPRKEIEIELGQAEFEVHRGELPAPEIEVVVGGASSTTRTGADGELRSRHRRDGDDAQVMLYRGAGEVRAATGSVQLAEGTGTTVKSGSAPTPPERLLAAPELVSPPDRAELPLDAARVELRWKPVAGADGYVVEMCADVRCGAILERSDRLSATAYRPRAGYRRLLYWRVTAVASSGLDGFPSGPRQLRPALLIAIQ
jgi:hypothetical protein